MFLFVQFVLNCELLLSLLLLLLILDLEEKPVKSLENHSGNKKT